VPYYYQRQATFATATTSLHNTHNNHSSIWMTAMSLFRWKIRASSFSSGLHLRHICRHMHDDVYIYCCKTRNGAFDWPEGPQRLIKLYCPYCYNGKKTLRNVKCQFPHLWNSNIKYFIVLKKILKCEYSVYLVCVLLKVFQFEFTQEKLQKAEL
jgi:hypothetical protein